MWFDRTGIDIGQEGQLENNDINNETWFYIIIIIIVKPTWERWRRRRHCGGAAGSACAGSAMSWMIHWFLNKCACMQQLGAHNGCMRWVQKWVLCKPPAHIHMPGTWLYRNPCFTTRLPPIAGSRSKRGVGHQRAQEIICWLVIICVSSLLLISAKLPSVCGTVQSAVASSKPIEAGLEVICHVCRVVTTPQMSGNEPSCDQDHEQRRDLWRHLHSEMGKMV